MKNMVQTLDNMHRTLQSLAEVLQAESGALLQLQKNPLALQTITDEKNQLLCALDYYDKQRQQQERELGVAAPYPQIPALARCWQTIIPLTRQVKQQNIDNGLQIEKQLAVMDEMRKVLNKTRVGQMVYGENGQAQHGAGYNRLSIDI